MSLIRRTEAELLDWQERIEAQLNVLGFSTIEQLENYVYTHGPSRIVAVRAPVEETQSQFPPSTQRRANKYQARKEELADTKNIVKILEREYNREKLELKRTLERENHEIYSKEVEIRRREAAVEMFENLKDDFSELDDFALETKKELNIALDELDAYDLVREEYEARELGMNGAMLEMQKELEEARNAKVTAEELVVEKDLEILKLQHRLTQITPASSSNTSLLPSSTPRPLRASLFLQPSDGPTPSRNIAPLRSSLTANRPPITSTSRPATRPSSAIASPSNTDVVFADSTRPTTTIRTALPNPNSTSTSTPAQVAFPSSLAPAHSVHLECYTELIAEVSSLNGKILKIQAVCEGSVFKWLKEQHVVYGAQPSASTSSTIQKQIPAPPRFLQSDEIAEFPILDDELASDEKAEELSAYFTRAKNEVHRLRELYDLLKGWKLKAVRALQEVAAEKMAQLEGVVGKGPEKIKVTRLQVELEKISPSKPRPTKMELTKNVSQALGLAPLVNSPEPLSTTTSSKTHSPRQPLSPRRKSISTIPPDGQPVDRDSLASEILPTPTVSPQKTSWNLFDPPDGPAMIKTPLAGTRWIVPPPNPSLSRLHHTPRAGISTPTVLREAPSTGGPTCDDIEFVDDGDVLIVEDLSSSQIPNDLVRPPPLTSQTSLVEPDTEPFDSQNFPPRPAKLPQELHPDTSSPPLDADKRPEQAEEEVEPDTESLTFPSSPPRPQQRPSTHRQDDSLDPLLLAFPPPTRPIPPPARKPSTSSSSEQEFGQMTDQRRRQIKRSSTHRPAPTTTKRTKRREVESEESGTDEEEQRRADLEGFESPKRSRGPTIRRKVAKEPTRSSKGKEKDAVQKKGKKRARESDEELSRESKKGKEKKKKKAKKGGRSDSDEGEEEEDDDADTSKEMFRKIHADRKAFNESKQAAKPKSAKREIEINPNRNQGKSFHYQEVVRGKKARQSMMGVACDECEAYYRRAYNKSAPPCDDGHIVNARMPDKAMEENLQRISRHRVQHIPDPDPPGYWQLGFPSTAQVDKIHAEAAEINAAKRKQQEAEANKPNGFYRYKK